MSDQPAFLVGDHLGQVKRVVLSTGKIYPLGGCVTPSSSNPVVSIEPFPKSNKHLIANKNGDLHIYDGSTDTTEESEKVGESLNKALPVQGDKVLLIYDKQVKLGQGDLAIQKRGEIKNARVNEGEVAFVGVDVPLKIFDIKKKTKIFEADPPDKDWLGIKPDVFVSGLDYVGSRRVVTCSKSDSVIRVYDTQSKPKPVITIDLNQTAFNEHADSARFVSVASTGDSGHSIIVGSNVGQILAIDLRINAKQVPKKKLQPRTHKVLGSFKGARGSSVKDIKIIPSGDDDGSYKVISCSLDRYLRIHNFSRTTRQLDKHVYMTTKPYCCSPILLESN